MSIKINIFPFLYQYTNNQRAVEVNGSTVGECLDDLVKQFPGLEKRLFDKKGKLLDYVGIWIKGGEGYPEELARPVEDGSELYLLTIVDGG